VGTNASAYFAAPSTERKDVFMTFAPDTSCYCTDDDQAICVAYCSLHIENSIFTTAKIEPAYKAGANIILKIRLYIALKISLCYAMF
jgi:hypothetical protein